MKIIYRFLIVSFFCQKLLFAQTNGNNISGIIRNIDSLNQLAFNIKKSNADSALSIILFTRNLSDEINYKSGVASSLLVEAGIYQQMGYDKKALSIYLEQLHISESANDSLNIARANQQIANSLVEANKLNQARSLFKKSITFYYALSKIEDVINIKNSLGLIELKLNNYKSADSIFQIALQQSIGKMYKYGQKKALFNLGLLNKKQGKLIIAEEYFEKSLFINESIRDSYGIISDKIELASIYLYNKEYKKAIQFSLHAYQESKKINMFELSLESAKILKNCFLKTNNLKGAIQWQDSIINTQKLISVNDKNFAFDFINVLKTEQEKQLESEKKLLAANSSSKMQTIIIAIVFVAFVVVLLVSILWYRNYKKAESIGYELLQKSEIINSNAVSLQDLNEQIVSHNSHLEETNKMKDRLITIISHDLRHPLVNTKSLIELIYNKYISGEETISLLNQLDAQYQKNISLLDNLLFWIRSKINGIQIVKKRLQLYQFSESVIAENLSALLEKNISIINTISEEIFVHADVEMLKIVLRNLISNSLKFTPLKGEIKLAAEIFNNSVHIYISDNGLGISRENLEKIKSNKHFTNKGTNNESGSGFGLLLCKDLILAQSGKLEINSVPNQGTTFTVTLPYLDEKI